MASPQRHITTGLDVLVYVVPSSAEPVTEDLWVVTWRDGIILKFAFLRTVATVDGIDIAEVFMHGEGPLGALNECRHTWWGEQGYIFYPNATDIRAMLEWLEAQGYALH